MFDIKNKYRYKKKKQNNEIFISMICTCSRIYLTKNIESGGVLLFIHFCFCSSVYYLHEINIIRIIIIII